jgi:hypothetical protein
MGGFFNTYVLEENMFSPGIGKCESYMSYIRRHRLFARKSISPHELNGQERLLWEYTHGTDFP